MECTDYEEEAGKTLFFYYDFHSMVCSQVLLQMVGLIDSRGRLRLAMTKERRERSVEYGVWAFVVVDCSVLQNNRNTTLIRQNTCY